MVDTLVSLGGFTFSSWGVPERINGGGVQHLVVHQLIGGGRVIDAMGWIPDRLRFTGRFRGADASANIRLLETVARSGLAVVFSYWTNRYQVIVSGLSWRFERFYEIVYDLKLEVLADLTLDSWKSAASTTDALFSSDLALLSNLVTTLPSLNSAVTNIASIQAMVGPLRSSTASSLAPLTTSVNAANSVSVSLQTTLDVGLPLSAVGQVTLGGNADAMSAELLAQANNMQQLSNSVQATSILSRMSINLASVGQ